MRIARSIWKHEMDQADKIVRRLVERDGGQSGWKRILLHLRLLDYLRFRRRHKLLRKNLLYTKQLAFEAAREVFQGRSRAEKLRFVEIETKRLLEREKTGFYTEKIRRKQLEEIELLLDHYLVLFSSNKPQYSEMIRVAYESRPRYLSFLAKLHQAEQGVIHATLATMRKGSKKGRESWFKRVKEASQKVRMDEAERIFPEV